MLTFSRKKQIINSYSSVLSNIIFDENVNTEELQKIIDFFKNNIVLNDINPISLKKYKSTVSNIEKNVDKDNKIQQFLLNILKRRYCFLLQDIMDYAKIKLQNKKNKTKKICIRSGKELSTELKKNIEETIKNQIGENNVEYKIDKNLEKNSIDFVSNNNICSISLGFYLK